MTARRDRGQLHQFVGDLVRLGVEQMGAKLGLPAAQAEPVMQAIADAVCLQYARTLIYVPAAFDPRNREIVRQWRESSRSARACTKARVAELAREHALTMRQVYAILRDARQAEFHDRQGVLPGLDQAETPAEPA